MYKNQIAKTFHNEFPDLAQRKNSVQFQHNRSLYDLKQIDTY